MLLEDLILTHHVLSWLLPDQLDEESRPVRQLDSLLV